MKLPADMPRVKRHHSAWHDVPHSVGLGDRQGAGVSGGLFSKVDVRLVFCLAGGV